MRKAAEHRRRKVIFFVHCWGDAHQKKRPWDCPKCKGKEVVRLK